MTIQIYPSGPRTIDRLELSSFSPFVYVFHRAEVAKVTSMVTAKDRVEVISCVCSRFAVIFPFLILGFLCLYIILDVRMSSHCLMEAIPWAG